LYKLTALNCFEPCLPLALNRNFLLYL
jgi:hypothetical protein